MTGEMTGEMTGTWVLPDAFGADMVVVRCGV